MNKRYTLKNSDNEIFTCIIDPEQEDKEQWEAVFAIDKGYGFTAERWGEQVKIVDYFHGETRASFQIISVEDTAEEASSQLSRI